MFALICGPCRVVCTRGGGVQGKGLCTLGLGSPVWTRTRRTPLRWGPFRPFRRTKSDRWGAGPGKGFPGHGVREVPGGTRGTGPVQCQWVHGSQ